MRKQVLHEKRKEKGSEDGMRIENLTRNVKNTKQVKNNVITPSWSPFLFLFLAFAPEAREPAPYPEAG